jgi:5-methylcytosine-specific restriction endonuclease McrA
MVRDKGRCQYCYEKLPESISTIDHVIPKRMYNRKADCHIWENVVIACKSCNIRKGGRTPSQAGMPLINKPYEPNAYNFWGFKKLPEWEEFLGYN